MMTRKITMMALIGGVVLGAAATEGFNVYRQSHDSQSFQQRVHCKAVADAYVKDNTDLRDNSGTGTSVTLDKVDYSPARNSCVAEVEIAISRGGTVFESVQDLLSGETLFSVNSTDDEFGVFQHLYLPRVWDYVMNNASQPVELEKEWTLTAPKSTPEEREQHRREIEALIESKNPPKSAPQQKIYLDPNTGERIQAPASQHKSAPQIDPATGERIQVPTSKYP